MHRVIKCIDRKQGGGFQGWGAWGVTVYWVCVGLQDEKVLQMMVVLAAQRCEWTCDTDVHLEMTKVVSRMSHILSQQYTPIYYIDTKEVLLTWLETEAQARSALTGPVTHGLMVDKPGQ